MSGVYVGTQKVRQVNDKWVDRLLSAVLALIFLSPIWGGLLAVFMGWY